MADSACARRPCPYPAEHRSRPKNGMPCAGAALRYERRLPSASVRSACPSERTAMSADRPSVQPSSRQRSAIRQSDRTHAASRRHASAKIARCTTRTRALSLAASPRCNVPTSRSMRSRVECHGTFESGRPGVTQTRHGAFRSSETCARSGRALGASRHALAAGGSHARTQGAHSTSGPRGVRCGDRRCSGSKRETPARAGVVGSAEGGDCCRCGAGGGRGVLTDRAVISQRSVMRRRFSATNGKVSTCLQRHMCATVSPAEFWSSAVGVESDGD
jgi:hypothetical protein